MAVIYVKDVCYCDEFIYNENKFVRNLCKKNKKKERNNFQVEKS